METIQMLGSMLGIGFAAGIRLYATILVLGLGIRFGWLHLTGSMQHLSVLANPYVLGAAGCACVIEFFADKIPWVDSVWDSFHTFIRPIGAVLLGATALTQMDPAWKLGVIVLCGGVALSSHGSKAATRLMVNHSPEPFTNIGLSMAEDLFVPAVVWISMRHPAIALGLVVAFLCVFAWIAPRVFRLLRVQLAALRALCFPRPASGAFAVVPGAVRPEIAAALAVIGANSEPLPDNFARVLATECAPGTAAGLRCVATKSLKGLRNSIGFLVIAGEDVVFVTRRMFLNRVHRVRLADITEARVQKGILMHQLCMRTADGQMTVVNLFRDVDLNRAEHSASARLSTAC